jgi:hypothetical protein
MGIPDSEREKDTSLTRETAQQLENFYTAGHSRVVAGIPSEENVPHVCRNASLPVAISLRKQFGAGCRVIASALPPAMTEVPERPTCPVSLPMG